MSGDAPRCCIYCGKLIAIGEPVVFWSTERNLPTGLYRPDAMAHPACVRLARQKAPPSA